MDAAIKIIRPATSTSFPQIFREVYIKSLRDNPQIGNVGWSRVKNCDP